MLRKAMIQPTRSFVAWTTQTQPRPGHAAEGKQWGEGRLNVRWFARGNGGEVAPAELPTLLLGDEGEWRAGEPDRNLAAGVPVRYDRANRSLVVHTSIVGLPPVYLYRGLRVTAITSDIHLLPAVAGVELEFEPASVEELGRIGHPVDHRTLFRDLVVVPSGCRLTLGVDGRVEQVETWQLEEAPPLDWPEFIERQIAAFTDAMRRMSLRDTFLSLTAGLDTRAVFAVLAQQERLVPAATMTAPHRSLDARTAAKLCRLYGIGHHEVVFNGRFERSLPDYLERASRLSGGLSALDQAPEVFFYDELGGAYVSRLSGNLGNQVGRGGTEGVSTRGADTAILAPHLRGAQPASTQAHWLLGALQRSAVERLEFIMKREIPFTSAGNYTVGNYFARQQTPYASRELIETLARRPRAAGGPSSSKLRMRLRDLSHRFLGEDAAHSFQRALLQRIGGYAASCPINWGWRPRGGVSAPGIVLGTATLFGMLARVWGLDNGRLRPLMQVTGLPALHDFRDSRHWLRHSLADYTRDTLASVRTAGIFDTAALDTTLDEHFSGRRDHYHTVTYALDLALAETHLRAARGT